MEKISTLIRDSVTYNDITLYLTQVPYIDGTLDNPYYTACAIDDNDDETLYTIKWELINDSDNSDDCCDWTNYTVSFYK